MKDMMECGLLSLRMLMLMQFDDDGQRQEAGRDGYTGSTNLTIR